MFLPIKYIKGLSDLPDMCTQARSAGLRVTVYISGNSQCDTTDMYHANCSQWATMQSSKLIWVQPCIAHCVNSATFKNMHNLLSNNITHI